MTRYGLLAGLVLAAAIGAAAPLGRTAGRADAADAQAAPDYDAAFVDVKAPEKVTAHEVFRVAITMRNTGARPWGSWPLRLRTVNPPNNTRWGTSYILVAQGRSVKSGQEYTFSSRLKAPAQPGKGVFQWQLCKDGKTWFGQVTPAKTIEVTARPSAPAATLAAAARVSDGKKVLTFADFEYLGSFKPPMTVGKARGAFSATGLTLRKTADGPDRMLMNYTHPSQVLFEVEVPELVELAGGKHAALHTAKLVKTWGAVTAKRPGMRAISPNGGFAWDEATRTLYWTWFHGYKTGAAPPVLAATKLADDGGMTSSGPWHVSVPGRLYKSYWGGVIRLPKAFAEKYTSGRTLALGFGGYYSICGPASRGPALGAIARPDPAAKAAAVTEMLYSTNRSPAPRDGDYFSANCGYWHDDPTGPHRGTWTFDDMCRAGAFVDAAGGHAYVAFVALGTGRLGYDFGAITHAGQSQYWYFYDPADLGLAAKGEKKPWTIHPTSMAKVTYPMGRSVTGACYDAGTRRLYLCTNSAYARGRERYPIVHVYGVK